jgi:hypothetical protein
MSKMHIAKRDIDRAKRAKAAEKRQRRQGNGRAMPAPTTERQPTSPSRTRGLSSRELLARVEEAHRQLESGAIDQEQFDEIKNELLTLLKAS